jgi:hypothetical protein
LTGEEEESDTVSARNCQLPGVAVVLARVWRVPHLHPITRGLVCSVLCAGVEAEEGAPISTDAIFEASSTAVL